MSQITVLPRHATTCAGCLGHGSCWVCLGTGRLFRAADRRVDCHRCNGSGLCGEELDRVIVLPDQRAAVI
jgi:hypothetical protein